MNALMNFIQSEDGAVTVDWVVLTAAIVGLGIAVLVLVANGATDVSDGLGASLSGGTVRTLDVPTYN